jgi:hypothetical protein
MTQGSELTEKKHKSILTIEWSTIKGGDQLEGYNPATNQLTNHN